MVTVCPSQFATRRTLFHVLVGCGLLMLKVSRLKLPVIWLLVSVAKYVNKKSDMDLAAKGLGAKEWNNSLKTKLSLLPKKLFRIRMSRNFGMKMFTMTNLSTECLIQLRSEERFSRNAETDLVCRLMLEKKKIAVREDVQLIEERVIG